MIVEYKCKWDTEYPVTYYRAFKAMLDVIGSNRFILVVWNWSRLV